MRIPLIRLNSDPYCWGQGEGKKEEGAEGIVMTLQHLPGPENYSRHYSCPVPAPPCPDTSNVCSITLDFVGRVARSMLGEQGGFVYCIHVLAQ